MSDNLPAERTMARGVDELIARLRDEGVTAGREEADRLLEQARNEAHRIVENARTEARTRLDEARKDADAYTAAGEQALKTAMRDAVLDMKARLMAQFSTDVERLVSEQTGDPEVLKSMILEVAGRTGQEAGVTGDDALTVVLPETVVGLEELRQNPEDLKEGALTRFVRELTDKMLRDGVSFETGDDLSAGIRVKVVDKDITLDLSDEAVAGVLLRHLQPRFRAILEGIVK